MRPCSHHSRTAAAVAVFVIGAGVPCPPLQGQIPADALGPDMRVRVWYPGTAPGFRQGVFLWQARDTLAFRGGDGTFFSVSAADITRLDKSAAGKSKWLAGMLIGGVTMAGAGALIGAAASDDCLECETVFPAAGAGLGLLVGLGVGALIGSGIRADNWVTVVPLISGHGSPDAGLLIYGRVALSP